MDTDTPRRATTEEAPPPQQDGTEVSANGPEARARLPRSQSERAATQSAHAGQEIATTDPETAQRDAPTTFPRPNIGIEATSEREVDAEFVSAAGTPAVLNVPAGRVRRRPQLPRVEVDDRLGRLLLSVVLAILLWFYVVNLNNPTTSARFPSLTVDVRGTGTNLKVVNEVEQVDANVQAPQNIMATLDRSDVQPYIDAVGLGPGVHELPVRADFNLPDRRNVNVTFIPDRVQVQLQLQVSEVFSVEVRQLGTPAFGYGKKPAQVTPAQVQVMGPIDAVSDVVEVIVQIDIDGKAATQQGARTPIALDAGGQEVKGLTFEPATVQVVQPIELLINYRDVPVRVPVEGQPVSGYGVSSITLDPTTVTICCSPEEINSQEFLTTEPVEITGTTSTVITTTRLILPPGITLYAGQSPEISVTVSIEPLQTTWQQSVAVTVDGVDPGLSAVVSPNRLELSLSGTFAQLQALKPTDIRAVVSGQGRGPGNYTIEPRIDVPQGIKIESVTPARVTVTLIAPTAVPTVTPSPLPTATATPTVLPASPTPLPASQAASPTAQATPTPSQSSRPQTTPSPGETASEPATPSPQP